MSSCTQTQKKIVLPPMCMPPCGFPQPCCQPNFCMPPCFPCCPPPCCPPPCCPPPCCPPPCQPCCPPPCQPQCRPCPPPCCPPQCPPCPQQPCCPQPCCPVPCCPKVPPCPCPPPCCPCSCPPKCKCTCCGGRSTLICVPRGCPPPCCPPPCCPSPCCGPNPCCGGDSDKPASFNNCNFYCSELPKGFGGPGGGGNTGVGCYDDPCTSASSNCQRPASGSPSQGFYSDPCLNRAAGDDQPAPIPRKSANGWGVGGGSGVAFFNPCCPPCPPNRRGSGTGRGERGCQGRGRGRGRGTFGGRRRPVSRSGASSSPQRGGSYRHSDDCCCCDNDDDEDILLLAEDGNDSCSVFDQDCDCMGPDSQYQMYQCTDIRRGHLDLDHDEDNYCGDEDLYTRCSNGNGRARGQGQSQGQGQSLGQKVRGQGQRPRPGQRGKGGRLPLRRSPFPSCDDKLCRECKLRYYETLQASRDRSTRPDPDSLLDSFPSFYRHCPCQATATQTSFTVSDSTQSSTVYHISSINTRGLKIFKNNNNKLKNTNFDIINNNLSLSSTNEDESNILEKFLNEDTKPLGTGTVTVKRVSLALDASNKIAQEETPKKSEVKKKTKILNEKKQIPKTVEELGQTGPKVDINANKISTAPAAPSNKVNNSNENSNRVAEEGQGSSSKDPADNVTGQTTTTLVKRQGRKKIPQNKDTPKIKNNHNIAASGVELGRKGARSKSPAARGKKGKLPTAPGSPVGRIKQDRPNKSQAKSRSRSRNRPWRIDLDRDKNKSKNSGNDGKNDNDDNDGQGANTAETTKNRRAPVDLGGQKEADTQLTVQMTSIFSTREQNDTGGTSKTSGAETDTATLISTLNIFGPNVPENASSDFISAPPTSIGQPGMGGAGLGKTQSGPQVKTLNELCIYSKQAKWRRRAISCDLQGERLREFKGQSQDLKVNEDCSVSVKVEEIIEEDLKEAEYNLNRGMTALVPKTPIWPPSILCKVDRNDLNECDEKDELDDSLQSILTNKHFNNSGKTGMEGHVQFARQNLCVMTCFVERRCQHSRTISGSTSNCPAPVIIIPPSPANTKQGQWRNYDFDSTPSYHETGCGGSGSCPGSCAVPQTPILHRCASPPPFLRPSEGAVAPDSAEAPSSPPCTLAECSTRSFDRLDTPYCNCSSATTTTFCMMNMNMNVTKSQGLENKRKSRSKSKSISSAKDQNPGASQNATNFTPPPSPPPLPPKIGFGRHCLRKTGSRSLNASRSQSRTSLRSPNSRLSSRSRSRSTTALYPETEPEPANCIPSLQSFINILNLEKNKHEKSKSGSRSRSKGNRKNRSASATSSTSGSCSEENLLDKKKSTSRPSSGTPTGSGSSLRSSRGQSRNGMKSASAEASLSSITYSPSCLPLPCSKTLNGGFCCPGFCPPTHPWYCCRNPSPRAARIGWKPKPYCRRRGKSRRGEPCMNTSFASKMGVLPPLPESASRPRHPVPPPSQASTTFLPSIPSSIGRTHPHVHPHPTVSIKKSKISLPPISLKPESSFSSSLSSPLALAARALAPGLKKSKSKSRTKLPPPTMSMRQSPNFYFGLKPPQSPKKGLEPLVRLPIIQALPKNHPKPKTPPESYFSFRPPLLAFKDQSQAQNQSDLVSRKKRRARRRLTSPEKIPTFETLPIKVACCDCD